MAERIPPGSLPGWGMSWWFAERGLDPAGMTMAERLEHVFDYWEAVDAGWRPDVRREDWVGTCDPFVRSR